MKLKECKLHTRLPYLSVASASASYWSSSSGRRISIEYHWEGIWFWFIVNNAERLKFEQKKEKMEYIIYELRRISCIHGAGAMRCFEHSAQEFYHHKHRKNQNHASIDIGNPIMYVSHHWKKSGNTFGILEALIKSIQRAKYRLVPICYWVVL